MKEEEEDNGNITFFFFLLQQNKEKKGFRPLLPSKKNPKKKVKAAKLLSPSFCFV
jgi:hypothetical protein